MQTVIFLPEKALKCLIVLLIEKLHQVSFSQNFNTHLSNQDTLQV